MIKATDLLHIYLRLRKTMQTLLDLPIDKISKKAELV